MTGAGVPVAVVGMAVRLPGAPDVESFWRNLRDGVESVHFFSPEELRAAGEAPERFEAPRYVPARAVVAEIDAFDAGFFGLTPGEAALIDPQQRLLVETAWRALEDAGYPPGPDPRIGIFAGGRENRFGEFVRQAGISASHADLLRLMVGGGSDYLATRAAYLLDLRGPALTVQTACSSSLTAVHLAVRALAAGDCDLALAGGSAIHLPMNRGYLWEDGVIMSADGHNRTFDAAASGTVGGEGAALVVLRPLADALRDGDRVYAVIRGTAINNDGRDKLGFTAPSVRGQVDLFRAGLASAGLGPETIDYVECHGTATKLGDPIELRALHTVFGQHDRPCWLGSVKTNIGHLDAAAGVSGLIKTVLMLQHQQLVPSLHVTTPNPLFEWQRSPLQVSQQHTDWPEPAAAGVPSPRRAAVTSLGLGGSNAFAVLEQPPPVPAAPAPQWFALPLSARTAPALAHARTALADALTAVPPPALADVAFTLEVGRHRYRHRAAVVCRSAAEAAAALVEPAAAPAPAPADLSAGRTVLLLPGQGVEVRGAAAGLYPWLPRFASALDEVAELVRAQAGWDPRSVLCEPYPQTGSAAATLPTDRAQVCLFAFQRSLAAALTEFGVRPDAVLGHSVGELAAAHLAGVLDLPDAVALSLARGQATQDCPEGRMVALAAPEPVARAAAERAGCHVAAVNAPRQTVLAGSVEAVTTLVAALREDRVPHTVLPATRAFHSPLMAPAATAIDTVAGRLALHQPRLTYYSAATGAVADAAVATAGYWREQLLRPVQFAAALTAALGPDTAYLDLGPSQTLRRLATLAVRRAGEPGLVVGVHPGEPAGAAQPELLRALAALWTAGAPVSWPIQHTGARRVRLPGHPMQRQRYPVPVTGADPAAPPATTAATTAAAPAPVAAPAGPTPTPGSAAPAADRPDEHTALVSAIFEEVLGAPVTDPAESFFALGGDSLMAAQVAVRVSDAFGLPLTVEEFFGHPSAHELASYLAEPA